MNAVQPARLNRKKKHSKLRTQPSTQSRRNRDVIPKKGDDCMAYSTHCESYKNRDAITLQDEVDCTMGLEKILVIASWFL